MAGKVVDFRFSKVLAAWCRRSGWGPKRLAQATRAGENEPPGIGEAYWCLWLKAHEKHVAGKTVYASQAGPSVDQWPIVLERMPSALLRDLRDLLPGAPRRIGRKECRTCGSRHDHPYLIKYCSIECKAKWYTDQLYAHDAEWRRRHLPAARKETQAG